MRLIDADEVKKKVFSIKDGYLTPTNVQKVIDGIPTVEAVEVVRCRDCRWADPVFGICKNPTIVRCEAEINPDDYCSRGWLL